MMENNEILRRYPRIVAALLAIAEEVDTNWACSVVKSAKRKTSPLAIGLVREAFENRRPRKEANRDEVISLTMVS